MPDGIANENIGESNNMEKTQEQARQEILDLVADYCRTYHINNKKPLRAGRPHSVCVPRVR